MPPRPHPPPMPASVREAYGRMTDAERGCYIKGLREGINACADAIAQTYDAPWLVDQTSALTGQIVATILTEFPDTRMVD